MDKWRGTAVPNTGLVEKVYLNINLNDEEITEICSKLTMKLEGWAEYILNTAESSDISLYIVDLEAAYNQKGYAIINAITEEKYYVSTQNEISDEYTFVGWNPDFNGEIVVNKELTPEHNGVESGTQNELIFELFSSEPIVKLKLNLDEFLTDLADSIRYVKGTEEKVNAQNYSSEIRKFKGASGSSTPVDKGAIHEGKYRVRYFDTDGTILKIEYVENGGKTTPPDNPSYDPDYLIFAEWNYDTDNYIVEQPTDIGATYDTVGDVTYMFCRFTNKTGLNPTLAITGATSIDWGDGTVDTNVSHTYANEGDYLIKISGNFNFNTFSSGNLLGSADLNSALKKCYIKSGIKKLENNNFIDCASLFAVSIPKTVDSIYSSAFSSCRSLIYVSIPNNIEDISEGMFYNCSGLISVSIPNSVKTIMNFAFQNCYSLINIIIPDGVTSIGNSAFQRCFCVRDFIFNCNSIPTLANSAGFTYMSNSSIMWFKDSIINGIKTATNWTTWSAYMKPLSWYPSLTDTNA